MNFIYKIYIIIFTWCICCTLHAQSFQYDKKYWGTYNIAYFINEDKQNSSFPLIIDLNKHEYPIHLGILVNNVNFGKKSKHNKNYILELSSTVGTSLSPEGFNKLESDILQIEASVIKNYSKPQIIYRVEEKKLRDTIEGEIKIRFNIKKTNHKVEGQLNLAKLKYKLLPKISTDKEAINIDSNYLKSNNVINEELAIKNTPKLTTNSNLVSTSLLNKEKELWTSIIEAVQIEDKHKIQSLCYRYRNEILFQTGNEERVWFYSIKYTEEDINRRKIIKDYYKKFPNGNLRERVVQLISEIDPQPNLDKETIFWKKTLLKNNRNSFKEYLQKYGNEKAKYAFDAKLKLQDFRIVEKYRKDKDSLFQLVYGIEGSEEKIPNISLLKSEDSILIKNIISSKEEFTVFMKPETATRLIISIPKSPWKKDTIEIDVNSPPLVVNGFKVDSIKKAIYLTMIDKGKPPYIVEIINEDLGGGAVFHQKYRKAQSNWKIDYDTLSTIPIGNFNYILKIRDQMGVNSKVFGPFKIEKIEKGNWWFYAIPLLIIGSFLFFISKWLISRFKIKTVNKAESTEYANPIETDSQLATTTTDKTNIKSRIKIHGKRNPFTNGKAAPLEKFLNKEEKYYELSMNTLWEDSSIDTVFINERCLRQINEFVFTKADIHRLPNGEMPEIGGFIIGKFLKENEYYNITLDRFIDIESEDNGVYQISFGAKAWSKLESEMENYDTEIYELIGWFHTHPGHGLFLSLPDQNIHNNFFRYPFQIAMEIDNVKKNSDNTYDLGIFSIKTNGELNNVDNLKNRWFQWKDLEDKLQNT